MKNRIQHNGTIAVNQVIRFKTEDIALIKVIGSAFTATLQSLDTAEDTEKADKLTPADSDYTDLLDAGGATSFTQLLNYQYTLGGGFYALKFTAATGTIKITITEKQ